jgi:hypothetical protein
MIRFRNEIAVAGCLIAAVAVIAVASANRESFGPVRLARIDGQTRYTTVDVPSKPVEYGPAAPSAISLESVARAQVSNREFSFGVVDPLQTHRHTFEIHNLGTAPLRIFDPGASCKCLGVELADEPIAPGKSGKVVVVWDAHPTPIDFLQRVTVATNDPANPRLQFTFTGKVRALLAAAPEELVARRVLPGQPTSVSTDVVSEVWDEFEIEDVRSPLPGMAWNVSPTPSDQLGELGMKSGQRLTVTLPPGAIDKSIDDALVIRVRPVAGDAGAPAGDSIEREIPFHATAIRRIAVYGDGVTSWGTIQLGQVDSNLGCERRYLVKINDEDPELSLAGASMEPDFVVAKLTPHEQLRKPGYYQLLLRIPPTGTSGVYQGDQQGRMTLKFSHPRIERLEMGLEFVLGPGDHRLGQRSSHWQPGS